MGYLFPYLVFLNARSIILDMRKIVYGSLVSLVVFGSSPASAMNQVSNADVKPRVNTCSSLSLNPNADCNKDQISAVIASEKIARDNFAQQYVSFLSNSAEAYCLYYYQNRTAEIRTVQSGGYASGPKAQSASFCASEARSWKLYNSNFPGYEALKANFDQAFAAAMAATPLGSGCSNCFQLEDNYRLQWIDLYNVRVPQALITAKSLADSYNLSKKNIERFETAYLSATATTVPHNAGDCPLDPNSSSTQILQNGKTYVGLGGVRSLCKNGRIVKQGKVPLEAKFLTCAVFNSTSDKGCYVKDSWGRLTWLFNLPQKTPKGKAVSNGSYFTNNGYCKVVLYKNFAYTNSCG